MAPKKPVLADMKVWSTSVNDMANGGAKVLRLDDTKTKIFVGGEIAKKAYLQSMSTLFPMRQWYLQSLSTTSNSVVCQLDPYKDLSESSSRLSTIIIDTDISSGAKSLIFMNILLTSNAGPFTPSFFKLAGDRRPVAYRGVNKDITIAFVQDHDSTETNVI